MTSYTDTSVANGTTYYYVVSAVNAGGSSANSTAASATPQAPLPPAPPVPSGLTATAGDARVTLAWNASSGATSYTVKRSTSASGPFNAIASVAMTSYTDTSVANGTTYYYVVSAVNAGGSSANSTAASATPQAPLPPAPPVPSGLTATAGDARVTLGWNASSGATSYSVKRGTSASGPFNAIASVATPGYTDTSVANGTTYYYVVSAANTGGSSANSAAASATPQAPLPSVPATPTGLSAVVGNAGVALHWNNSAGATSYSIKRSTSASGPFTVVASLSTTTYADTLVVSGSTYYYVVSAVNAAGESANSGVVSVSLQLGEQPAAPRELQAEPGDRGTIKLEWKQSSSTGIVQNKIYRSTRSGGPYTLVATVSPRDSYRDSRLPRRTTYYYVVTAVDASGRESAYSRQDSARTK